MEMPARIEEMTKEQLDHLDRLVNQIDSLYPDDRGERLAKDPHLAILPSGMKLTTHGVQSFEVCTQESLNRMLVGNYVTEVVRVGDGLVYYRTGALEVIADPHDIAAFNAALNDIGVYIAAPTLKGDDADGDGVTAEGSPV